MWGLLFDFHIDHVMRMMVLVIRSLDCSMSQKSIKIQIKTQRIQLNPSIVF